VTLAAETAWHGLSGIAAAWLDLSSPWAALGPAIAAGALLLALFGNSMLLTGDRNGLRRSRARRL
jgi:hypothetical protein